MILRTVANICLVLIFSSVFEIMWLFLFFLNKINLTDLRRNMISSLIILIETYNSGILLQITNSLICEKIDSGYYLTKDLKINCDTDEFLNIVIFQ